MHLYLGGRDDWLVKPTEWRAAAVTACALRAAAVTAAPCCALRAAAVASSALTIENC